MMIGKKAEVISRWFETWGVRNIALAKISRKAPPNLFTCRGTEEGNLLEE